MEKKKILVISDTPLVPSGVGTQTKYLLEGLLATGKYRFICAGGAVKHPDYRPQKVAPEKYGDDWIIFPVDGYGDKNFLRQILVAERPDAILIITDPRFFIWLWEMEDEIHSFCPLIYWHVWDNDPVPRFNSPYYMSTDYIAALSLKTYGLLQGMDYPKERFSYIPHSLPSDLFKPLPEEVALKQKRDSFGPHGNKEFVVFWNNRNARRKQTGDVIAAFSKFAHEIGKDKTALLMHTAVHDPEGQDVLAVAKNFDIDSNLIISDARVAPEQLNVFYNAADCTLSISSNEGFGLSTLESLYAGSPIIVHMTGGLQFQVGDWWEQFTDFSDQEELTSFAKNVWKNQGTYRWFGAPVFPASRSCTGSQQIPYIYDDRVNHKDVVTALVKMYRLGRGGRRQLGLEAREWATQRFSMERMISDWDAVLQEQISKYVNSPHQSIRLASF